MVRLRCPKCGRMMDDDTDLVVLDGDSVDFTEEHEERIFKESGLELWIWRCPYCNSISIELTTKWYDGVVKFLEPYESIELADKVYVLRRLRSDGDEEMCSLWRY